MDGVATTASLYRYGIQMRNTLRCTLNTSELYSPITTIHSLFPMSPPETVGPYDSFGNNHAGSIGAYAHRYKRTAVSGCQNVIDIT